MTTLFYIIVIFLTAVMLSSSLVIVFKEGESDSIAQYTQDDEGGPNK